MSMRRNQQDFKTKHMVFDDFTNRTIFKLISEGHFDGLESPVAIGKEANIFSAKKGDERVMVKIYRLETCDFNRMYDYIREDPRYGLIKGKKRNVIFKWVQREYRNLLKARAANVSVPTPYTFKNNVLVLEFIGKGTDIAPMMKNQRPKDPKKFLDEIIVNMERMHKAGLVHADLSAFNILNFNEKPVFIDFSQASTLDNSRSEEFLDRDIRNISSFFRKLNIKVDENKIRKKVLGLQKT